MWTHGQREEFLKTLCALAEIYGRELSKTIQELYYRVLVKYPFEAVMRALMAHLENAGGNGQFFPKPADIVNLIDGNPEDRAIKAWTEVIQALERVGTWASVKFRDPITMACIEDLGGWIKLGQMTEEELERLSHRFCKLYRHYYRTGVVPEISHLPGHIEHQNTRNGYPDMIPDPTVVGTPLPSHVRIALRAPGNEAKAIPQARKFLKSIPQGVS